MTGKDLIIYILANDLEHEMFFVNGKIPGLMTAKEAAVKFEVGLATIQTWFLYGALEGFMIGETLYIPATAQRPTI